MRATTEKLCSRCSTIKPSSEFDIRVRNGVKYLQSPCNPCRRKYQQERRDKGIIVSNPKYHRIWKLSNKYGLSWEDYLNILDSQDWCCPICSIELENENPHVDHCHETGNVRGILCGNCNKGLGMFSDDINRIREAVKYLEGKIWNA